MNNKYVMENLNRDKLQRYFFISGVFTCGAVLFTLGVNIFDDIEFEVSVSKYILAFLLLLILLFIMILIERKGRK